MRYLAVTSMLLLGMVLTGCRRGDANPPAAAPQEDETIASIRKQAAFDLACQEKDVQVTLLEAGSMMSPASYGAVCGEKRARYLERMGTVLRQ
jgi:hypothetical protein